VKLSDKAKWGIRIAYNVLVSVMLVVTGVLFAYECYLIYKSGPSPFTRESIAEAFSHISVMTYITISLVVIGAGLHIFIPQSEEKLKGSRTPSVLVSTLAKRVNSYRLPDDLTDKIEKERKLRRVLSVVRTVLLVLSATLPLIYLLNPANFPAESGQYNAEILHGMLLYLAFLTPLAVYEVVYIVVNDASLNREHDLLKEAIKVGGVADFKIEEPISRIAKIRAFIKENEKPITLGVRIAFVGCAVGFIIAGVINGGMTDVLNKAIKICTECIGLG
jgi:hypothetical protein